MNKKIVILGHGFIGTELYRLFLKQNYNISIFGREKLDILDTKEVENLLEKENPHLLIFVAKKAGRRFNNEDNTDFYQNIKMFENIAICKHYFSQCIVFGSGNEFNWIDNIDCVKEQNVFEGVPNSNYDFSKWLIARRMHDLGNKFLNLRLFGCFSENELSDRFIKANLLNYINKRPIIIFQNRKFDFIHIEDLFYIIKTFLDNHFFPICYPSINCVYKTKHTLLQIGEYINTLSDYKVPIEIENKNIQKSYTGSSDRLNKLGFDLDGLFARIKETYNILKENDCC